MRGGGSVCSLSLATTRAWKDKDTGEKREETEWHRVTVFGKQGEACAKFLAKGRQVYVEGRLRTSSYEKEGQKHYSTEVVADDVQFLGSGGGGKKTDDDAEPSKPSPARKSEPVDDIPF